MSKFDVQYRPCTAIKGQVIVDFIAEFTHIEGQGVGEIPQWSIHMDGLSIRQEGRVSVVLYSPEYEAEYEALIIGLDLAKAIRAPNVVVYCNS